ncbi:MAG: hypothetical protein JRI54_00305 [Deltaproteobacteria bacterium]|nr:hypothetical protein [Deltaproteobacteria bacterium]
MKLGDKVRFSKELVKRKSGRKQRGWVEWRHGDKLAGVICGVRTIWKDGEWVDNHTFCPEHPQKVYLVATDLHGFHRVPKEWLERAPGDEDKMPVIRNCLNCKYQYQSGAEEPCHDCYDGEKWKWKNES